MNELIDFLDTICIHSIIRDTIIQEIKEGKISTKAQLKAKINEYEGGL